MSHNVWGNPLHLRCFMLLFYSVPPSTRQRRRLGFSSRSSQRFCRHTSLPLREQRLVSYGAFGAAVGYHCLKRRLVGSNFAGGQRHKEETLLKLRKVEIVGFKSFCERTIVTFSGSGTTCIVGPNGCGKSNVVDAISWVLGEQSHKSLRAERMADCIFNGTVKRPPMGLAEVTITLEDPELAEAARFVLESAEADSNTAIPLVDYLGASLPIE